MTWSRGRKSGTGFPMALGTIGVTGSAAIITLLLTSSAGQAARTAAAVAAVAVFLFGLGAAALIIRRDSAVRRRAEQALRESESLLSQFMENLPIGVMVVDAEGRPRFANNAAVEIIGARVLIDLGDDPLPLLAPDRTAYPAERTPVARALTGAAATIDDALIRTHRGVVPIEMSAAPVFDPNGRIAYAIATFTDISGRRAAEEALRRAKEDAELASRTKSDFLARMSHELRTPLNSVIGFANVLLKNRSGALLDQEMQYLERIQQNGRHLLLLINDILDLSRIEAGRVEVRRQPVDVSALISEIVEQWAVPGATGAVALRAECPGEADPLVTDAARLRQVLVNLVGNAVKFTHEGEVVVRAVVEPGTSRVARIVVRDTGIGIPHDRLDAIFDDFEQADSTTARRYGGTGLGLPISRALCALLGYGLTARSEVGVGSEFIIELTSDDTTSPNQTLHGAAAGGR